MLRGGQKHSSSSLSLSLSLVVTRLPKVYKRGGPRSFSLSLHSIEPRSTTPSFFLEHARELRIIVLKEGEKSYT
jgi:hypothetical protein